ncbi:MAG: DUF4250 domain-containing protein [Lachnospiraceae bacterium]|nr:DUF4250 domain-containing protein [Lachnospiraceae bacterium]
MASANIPNDPIILLSFINTKLRDEYANLSALCDDLELDPSTLTGKLSSIGYTYNETMNRFL